jgi:hypothetical protein
MSKILDRKKYTIKQPQTKKQAETGDICINYLN